MMKIVACYIRHLKVEKIPPSKGVRSIGGSNVIVSAEKACDGTSTKRQASGVLRS